MTRLIDADALTEWLEVLPNSTYKDTVMNVLIDMPTVEAIPIEWLKCKRNEHNNDGFAWVFEAVMDDWRREEHD